MVAIQDKPEANISSDAYDLLDCFVCGLDKVVYEIATEIARARSQKNNDAEPIEIETEDVIEAGNRLIHAIKESIVKNEARSELSNIIKNVEQCFTWRQQKAQ